MRKFTPDTAVAAIELEQMVADYFHTLDTEGGGSAVVFFTDDCDVDLGAIRYKGIAAMKQFYEGIAERINTEQKDGVRTMLHGFVNLRIVFPTDDRATITFICIAFSGDGAPPVMNATTPSVVTDVRFECRREAGGQWHIFGYYGRPVFVGNDPFMTRTMVR